MSQMQVLVRKLKENNQDFEYYPTSDEIINIVKSSLKERDSVLDCGAGDGSTLDKLTKGNKYAIEKSQILLQRMPAEVFIIGCEFYENSLIDKKVDVVFCNPPYSEYKEWALKIINEANSREIYLVIPERWKNQEGLIQAIRDRKATFEVIGNTDFLEADRPARAKVDIVKITLQGESYYRSNSEPDVDPFRLWVEKEFPISERKKDAPEGEFTKKVNELVPGRGLVPVLVELYLKEMVDLQNNFKAISELDQSIFTELQIDFKSIMGLLQGRIKGLKEKYWRELFKNFNPITDRLIKASRENLLKTLTDNVSVDFTESNIYAVTLWAIKNANGYFDSQLIDVFTGLVEKANLIAYKSNQNTWGNDRWRFRGDLRDGRITNFGLDYRCVISVYNTFSTRSYDSYDFPNGLSKNVNDTLNDILTVANNLGFTCPSWENSFQKEWVPSKAQDFYLNRGEKKILMSVRAYRNGNIHIKFNQAFLRKLNVEFGRLKGWLRTYQEAATELDIPELEAKSYFKTNFALDSNCFKMLE